MLCPDGVGFWCYIKGNVWRRHACDLIIRQKMDVRRSLLLLLKVGNRRQWTAGEWHTERLQNFGRNWMQKDSPERVLIPHSCPIPSISPECHCDENWRPSSAEHGASTANKCRAGAQSFRLVLATNFQYRRFGGIGAYRSH